jgi:microcystin-dependent protein
VSSLDAGTALEVGTTGPVDNRPLTQDEYNLLQRLLSDPFSIPIQFKTWLVSYLETSDLSLPIGAIYGLKNILGIAGVGGGTLGILPAGLIFPYGGTVAPTGALMCDGTSYSKTVQSRLFQAIGTAYGSQDSLSFNVPDLQERIPVGRGTKSTVSTLGQNEGKPLGSRGPQHGHAAPAVNDPQHSHAFYPAFTAAAAAASSGANGYGAGDRAENNYSGSQNAATGISVGPVGPQGGPIDAPAFIVVNFIIVA